MNKLLSIVLLFLLAVGHSQAEKADLVKSKLALLDAIQAAPDAFFSGENVWFLEQLVKGLGWEEAKGVPPDVPGIKELNKLSVAQRKEKMRESVLLINDAGALLNMAKALETAAKNPAAAPVEPDEQIPHEEILTGVEKGMKLLGGIYTEDEAKMIKQRKYDNLLKEVDNIAEGKNQRGNSMPLESSCRSGPSKRLTGELLAKLMMVADGFTCEEADQRLKKVPADTLKKLQELPLVCRRRIAGDFAYGITDSTALSILTPPKD